jgi:hypothetical protein
MLKSGAGLPTKRSAMIKILLRIYEIVELSKLIILKYDVIIRLFESQD